jgi:SAM-dependent methyltransferase
MLQHLFVDERPPAFHVAELGDLGGAIGAALLASRAGRAGGALRRRAEERGGRPLAAPPPATWRRRSPSTTRSAYVLGHAPGGSADRRGHTAALGDARTVLNVGAARARTSRTGLDVVALEPSPVMIAQRPEGSAAVLRGSAERIPLPDDSVDAAMAVLSDHHWTDRAAGLRELRRVARRRVVVVNNDPAMADRFWLTREYLRSFGRLIPPRYRAAGRWERELADLVGPVAVHPLAVPARLRRRLLPRVLATPARLPRPRRPRDISVFRLLPDDDVRTRGRRAAARPRRRLLAAPARRAARPDGARRRAAPHRDPGPVRQAAARGRRPVRRAMSSGLAGGLEA